MRDGSVEGFDRLGDFLITKDRRDAHCDCTQATQFEGVVIQVVGGLPGEIDELFTVTLQLRRSLGPSLLDSLPLTFETLVNSPEST